jgi:hemolysin activation/secretion protein
MPVKPAVGVSLRNFAYLARRMARRGSALLGACVAVCVIATAAAAAPLTLPGAVQPGHDRQVPQPEATPDFDFSVEAPQRSPVPRAVDEIKFKLTDIRIDGTKTIPASAFRPLYADMIGKQISLANIFDVADGIEKQYKAAGYLLVRAYVPPQHVKDGIFTIHVVEGFVAGTSVQGSDNATQARVKAYLSPVLNQRPLQLATVERALLLSNDLPGVAATGILRPSPGVPGASDLVVTLTQPDVTGGLSTTNRGSHLSGVWTVTGNAEYNGIFGSDELDASLTMSPHALDQQLSGQMRYRTAIGDDGLVGSLIGSVSHGAPAGSLGAAGIKTDSWAVGPRLTYPLVRSRLDSVSLDGGLTFQDAKVQVAGAAVNHDIWRVADLGLTYSSGDFLAGTFSSTLDVAQGLPILGATSDNSPHLSLDGKTDFTKLTGLMRYVNVFSAPWSFALTANGQYGFQRLVTGEEILFGGSQIGRGYDPGGITGDSGVGGSFELRYDTRITDWDINALQPYTFYDAAKVWSHARPAATGIVLPDESLDSVGAGARFWFPYNIYWDVEAARALQSVPGSDNGKRETKFLTDLAVTF